MIIVGLDPGTGASSPTGLFIYNSETLEILHTAEITATHKSVDRRIKKICDQLRPIFETLEGLKEPYLVCIEYFVMQGKSGEMLHRLIGGFLTLIAPEAEIEHIQNTSVKLLVGGHGSADKMDVARGLSHHFKENKDSRKLIDDLTFIGHYDVLDAGAIAVAGYTRWVKPLEKKLKRKSVKSVRKTLV